MKHLLSILFISIGFLTLLAYVAPFCSPTKYWVIALLGLGYPFLLITNLLLLVGAVILKSKLKYIPLAILIIGFMNINSFANFNINSSSEEEQLTIMSFNIAELIGYGGITRKFKPEPFIDLINQAKPDILAIQEFPNWIASPNIFIESITKKTGLTYFFRKGNSSLITFSKYPITKKEYVDYGIDVTGYLYTEVSIKGSPYQIYNFHLNSNKITQLSKSFVKEKKINALHNKGTWRDIKTMCANYKNAALKRCYNAFAINKKATGSSIPTILLGDLNDVPMSRAYHLLANEFSDAFESAGQGIGTTYQGKLPLLRIDHILYNHKLRAHSFESISTSISDHKAIKATLSLISSK